MTISAAVSEITYAGDGITQTFPVPFPFDSAADLKVYSTDTTTGAVTPVITGWSTVNTNVFFASPPAATVQITILDDPTLTQPTDYVSNDAFPAESHEHALDRITRLCKRLHQQILRTIRFSDAETITDGTVGSVSTRKGKYLFFNAVTGAVEYATALIGNTLSQSSIVSFLGADPLRRQTPAELTALVTPVDVTYPELDLKRYGATPGGSTIANRIALQTAIAVCNAKTGGGVVIVPADISYGYNVTVPATQPDLSACTRSVVVLDYGQGNSFAGYPAAYDGAQVRMFFHTPEGTGALTFTGSLSGGATSATLAAPWGFSTGPWPVTFSNGNIRNVTLTNGATTATWTTGLLSGATASALYTNFGQHQGNQIVLRGPWNPGLWIQSDGILAAPNAAGRLALDNRRAQVGFGVNGDFRWNMGQGTLIGPDKTDEELTNFVIEKIPVAGDTIGHFNVVLAERKTGNIGMGLSSNVPDTSFDFVSVTTGFDQAKFENGFGALSRIFLRSNGGSTKDGGIGIDTGAGTLGSFYAWNRTTGHLFDIDMNSRMFTFPSGSARHEVATSFPTVAIAANSADVFLIPASTNATYAVGVPSNPTVGQQITINVRNTSGGALGTANWDAIYKMAAWTNPASATSRSITFRYNNVNWIEMSRTPADVPN